jgi:uncharacterized protein (TIGR02246 family)
MLERKGFEVRLVNARQSRMFRGARLMSKTASGFDNSTPSECWQVRFVQRPRCVWCAATCVLVGLAIGFISPVFAQQTVDPQIVQEMRAFATKYDAAINQRDTSAIAALYTEDAIWRTSNEGAFRGRQAITKEYVKLYFRRWNIHKYATTVNRVAVTGNDVRSTGTWSCASNRGAGRDSGPCSWVLVHEGKTLKIRLDSH